MRDVTSMQEDYTLIDYNDYIMNPSERLTSIGFAAAILFLVGLVFFSGLKFWDLKVGKNIIPYFNIILSLLLCPFAFLYPKMKISEIIRKRKNDLNIQFKDVLYTLSSSLTAGKSIESAFKEVLKDLSIIYSDPNTYIIKEVEYLVRRLNMNVPIEVILSDLAKRSHLEDIKNFVDVFYTCKRTGGNMVEIIKNTSNIISDKIEIKQEIETMLASKKFEQKVMNIMPIGMILVLSFSAGDFVEPIFTQPIGKVVMLFSIILLVSAYFISKKIMDIKV